MLTTLAFTVALAEDAPRLSDAYTRDPVSIERFENAQQLAHVGQAVTGIGMGVTLVGAFVMVGGLANQNDGALLGGAGLVLVGGIASFVGPIMLYGYGGGARGALLDMGLDVPGTLIYTAWGLWGGGLALGLLSAALIDPTGVSLLSSAMQITAFILGSVQLGLNKDAARGAGIASRRHEPLQIAVAPWTDGYRKGAMIAVGF